MCSQGSCDRCIYRRWTSRLELIHDAALTDLPPGRVRPTGDLRRDLGRFLRAYLKTFQSPVVRAAMPGLVAATSNRTSPPPRAWTHLSVRPQFRAILAAAPDAVDPTIDPDHVFDLVLGVVLVNAIVPDSIRRQPTVDQTVDLLLRLLAPRNQPPAT